MFDLTILIPTHKRPKYFQRCIKSVVDFCPHAKIIVNNDSADIDETYDAEYFYYQGKNLSDVYKYLVSMVQTEYLYFLEDDDFLLPNFEEKIKNELDHDLIIGKYIPCDRDYSSKRTFKYTMGITKDLMDINNEYFQLGQVIFKTEIFDGFKWFNNSDIHNDYRLVHSLMKDNNYKYINKFLYRQNYVGDNISINPKISHCTKENHHS